MKRRTDLTEKVGMAQQEEKDKQLFMHLFELIHLANANRLVLVLELAICEIVDP